MCGFRRMHIISSLLLRFVAEYLTALDPHGAFVLLVAGFIHTAFAFSHECMIARNPSFAKLNVPPGALITMLQKGVQLARIEAHLDEVSGGLRRQVFSLEVFAAARFSPAAV